MVIIAMIKLYGYYRSSAAYRVRIALFLKGLEWKNIPVNLFAGEQKEEKYHCVNPQGLVPAMEIEEKLLTQSLAIIEWLDEEYPNTTLLPKSSIEKAQVRALAYQVAMDIHPLNNLRVTKFLTSELGVNEQQKLHWYQHWITQGFEALELSIDKLGSNGNYCFGDCAGLADVCLIPQIYNALRFDCDLATYPLIRSIYQHCNSLDPFQRALPEVQADCPSV